MAPARISLLIALTIAKKWTHFTGKRIKFVANLFLRCLSYESFAEKEAIHL